MENHFIFFSSLGGLERTLARELTNCDQSGISGGCAFPQRKYSQGRCPQFQVLIGKNLALTSLPETEVFQGMFGFRY